MPKDYDDIYEKGSDIKPVVKNKVTARKPSVARNLMDAMFTEDLPKLKDHILYDKAIPGIKRFAVDFFASLLGVEDFTRSRDYNRISKKSSSRIERSSLIDDYEPSSGKNSGRFRYGYDDVVCETRGDAEYVLKEMYRILGDKGSVSVGDMYRLAGLRSEYTDFEYGWYDLTGACPRPVRDGYLLTFPRPVSLLK